MPEVFIMMAQMESRAGSHVSVLKTAVVTQAVTVLEQFLRLILEGRLDEGAVRATRGWHRGEDEKILVSMSSIEASGRGFQNIGPIGWLLRWLGPGGLADRLLGKDGPPDHLLGLRHDLVHAFGVH